MSRSEFDKLFYYETPPNPFHPPGSFPGHEMFVLNDMVVKGAPLFGLVWFTGPQEEKDVYKPHWHDDDEVMAIIGSDPDNPTELNGEVEFWIEDERYLLTKSCMIYIPKGLQHAPMFPRRVDKPILWTDTSPVGVMKLYYNNDPRWDRFKDAPQLPEGMK
jgi:hypothetical protein